MASGYVDITKSSVPVMDESYYLKDKRYETILAITEVLNKLTEVLLEDGVEE